MNIEVKKFFTGEQFNTMTAKMPEIMRQYKAWYKKRKLIYEGAKSFIKEIESRVRSQNLEINEVLDEGMISLNEIRDIAALLDSENNPETRSARQCYEFAKDWIEFYETEGPHVENMTKIVSKIEAVKETLEQ